MHDLMMDPSSACKNQIPVRNGKMTQNYSNIDPTLGISEDNGTGHFLI